MPVWWRTQVKVTRERGILRIFGKYRNAFTTAGDQPPLGCFLGSNASEIF
jgi:hypothetical protein